MTQQQSPVNHSDVSVAYRTALKSQYHAALAMFRDAIERCPDDLWVARPPRGNQFWRIAYHTLYFTHLYMVPKSSDFRAWEHHQTGVHDMDDDPSPTEPGVELELPHRPPQTGMPYTKAEILEYWRLCDQMVEGNVNALDLLDPSAGFSWKPNRGKAELQIENIRHIQHHTAQLAARVRETTGAFTNWAGARPLDSRK
ncbi:MAG: DinB family protein [Tepidisphaeraceae bacterium]